MEKLKTISSLFPSEAYGENLVHAMLLAHLFSPDSPFYQKYFPRELLCHLLRYFAPIRDSTTFSTWKQPAIALIPYRTLAPSYYQICFELNENFERERARKKALAPKFPLSIKKHESYCADGELVRNAKSVLKFLFAVREEFAGFTKFSPEQLEAAFDEYALFLLLIKEMEHDPEKTLLTEIRRLRATRAHCVSDSSAPIIPPSNAVRAIWYSHMLQSDSYAKFIARYLLSPEGQINDEDEGDLSAEVDEIDLPIYSHCCVLDDTEFSAFVSISNGIWTRVYGAPENYPTHQKSKAFQRMKRRLASSGFGPREFLLDQDWLVEFVKFTRGSQEVFSDEFLKKAELGYHRMLYLKWKNIQSGSGTRACENVEGLHFAPCPAVDLIWHTHLLRPHLYRRDTKAILGCSPKHKLLRLDERTHRFRSDREFKEEKLWVKEFGESLFDYS